MNEKLRKVLAGLVIIAVLFGWYVTIFGIGSFSSIKDLMKFGLDINGGVYVVLEADSEDIEGLSAEELTRLCKAAPVVSASDTNRAVNKNDITA